MLIETVVLSLVTVETGDVSHKFHTFPGIQEADF